MNFAFVLILQQKPVVQRTPRNMNYGIYLSARHQGASIIVNRELLNQRRVKSPSLPGNLPRNSQ